MLCNPQKWLLLDVVTLTHRFFAFFLHSACLKIPWQFFRTIANMKVCECSSCASNAEVNSLANLMRARLFLLFLIHFMMELPSSSLYERVFVFIIMIIAFKFSFLLQFFRLMYQLQIPWLIELKFKKFTFYFYKCTWNLQITVIEIRRL